MEIAAKILLALFLLLQFLFIFYLLQPMFLLLINLLFSKKKSGNTLNNKAERNFDFAAIVTAHQDVKFIPPLVDSFLKQHYNNFIVYVVADDCDTSNLSISSEKIKLLKPQTAIHSKIKSIKYAVENFTRPHEILIVFDSDNLVHPDYLSNLNNYFRRGFKAVQTHMLSKNTDTVYAKLDSIGHIYNTFVERKARMDMGLSSSILGLGIAIDSDLYTKVIYKDNLGGFDKKLQADLISNTTQLAFAEDAIVFDEKVDDGVTLEKQRTRWLYTYFKYFPVNFKLLKESFHQLNFNRMFFAINALRPPLFITLALAFVFMATGFLITPTIGWLWAAVIFTFIISFILIVLTQSVQKGMGQALVYLPAFVIRQLRALLKIKKAGKDFLKTEHSKVLYIDDILGNELV